MPEIEYQRLTRARSRASIAVRSFYSLWLGPDHLLAVNSNGYTEKYKRFYFRDIQAITICKTKRRFIWNWILGSLGVLCFAQFAGSFMKASSSLENYIFISIATIVFGIPLLLNNLLGPTCAVQLRTAVQIEALPSLRRLRPTRKILTKIRPLILAAQESIPSSEPPPTVDPESPSKTLNPEP